MQVQKLTRLFFLLFLLGLLLQSCQNPLSSNKNIDFIDPFIGTDNSDVPTKWEANGGTYPGAAWPFGMVQLTPDGYRYADKKIRSFSFLGHTSGYPHGSSGFFTVMPFVLKNNQNDFSSKFSHSTEKASVGYYRVMLEKPGVDVELTVAQRSGMCRFSFQASQNAALLFTDINEYGIEANKAFTGRTRDYFFCVELDCEYQSLTLTGDSLIVSVTPSENGMVQLKAGFSKVSEKMACVNLKNDIVDWDFEKAREKNKSVWEEFLSVIEVEGGTEQQKTIFYTALYHSMLDPHLISDVGDTNYYKSLSPWDTYKSKQPLLTLLKPQLQAEMIESELQKFDEYGWLPVGPMTGNHNIPIIVDSYMKGIQNFDVKKAYEAMRKSLFTAPYGRRDIKHYLTSKYVPAEASYGVTKTLEYAYNDWALSVMAKELGYDDDYEQLLDRASYFKNTYNADDGFMVARKLDGSWTKGGYREGDKWNYTWLVPHDIIGLAYLMGGVDSCANKLDFAFKKNYYVHDNEPPLHYSYLFNSLGKPWKTQYWVREIMNTNYSDVPGGLSGNDDLGALSAWYVFSSLGMFPDCPGASHYQLTAPLFEKATIHFENGKDLLIRCKKQSDSSRYICSVHLNKVELKKSWIDHSQLLQGGELLFELIDMPDKEWGKVSSLEVPGMTKGKPDFDITHYELSSNTTKADQPVFLSMDVVNNGTATGSYPLNIHINGNLYDTEWISLNAGENSIVKIPITLYEAGIHDMNVNNQLLPRIEVSQSPTAKFRISDIEIPSPPVLEEDEEYLVTARVKNICSFEASTEVNLIVDGEALESGILKLNPGEEQEIKFASSFDSNGIHTIRIANSDIEKVLVVRKNSSVENEPQATNKLQPVLRYNFEQKSRDTIKDITGRNNLGIVHGNVKWVDGLFGKAIQTNAKEEAYIEIPQTRDLQEFENSKETTISLWVYPMDEENFADIISKGDWAVIQAKASNTEVNYYYAGYQRGEAYGTLPENWNRSWHHLAGVCDSKDLKIYLDGKLLTVKPIEHEKQRMRGVPNWVWNIGRNSQNPDRVFNGYIDEIGFYAKALSEREINKLILRLE